MAARPSRPAATVAIAGNPNSGKTTLFNALTGSSQRVGNWPGVTVERKEGRLLPAVERFLAAPFVPAGDRPAGTVLTPEVRVVDLPGIYSLSVGTEDEAVARDFLLAGEADLVVDVVDATNLQRNLFLTLQLLEMKVPVLVVLNQIDLAARRGVSVDTEALARLLGCPVVAANSTCAQDVAAVAAALRGALSHGPCPGVAAPYPSAIEECLETWRPRLSQLAGRVGADERWIGLRLLEGDSWMEGRAVVASALSAVEIRDARSAVSSALGEELDVVIAGAKYGLIQQTCRQVLRAGPGRGAVSNRLDRVVLSPIFALPIFLAIMFATFWFTMVVGGAFVGLADGVAAAVFVDGVGALLAAARAPAPLATLLAGGLGNGIRTVASFVPIIFALFAALAFLEDSGYMARAAYIMDRLMRSLGLPGRAFIPMMVGFGCTVPAIMSTRTLASRRDRFITIFMAPFMSCGARLPVYALFAAAFFPRTAAAVVFSLYGVGIVVAVLVGLLLNATLSRAAESTFVMELPSYHAPRPGRLLAEAFARLKDFVLRTGTTIALIVAVLGVVGAVRTGPSRDETLLASAGRLIVPVFGPIGIEPDNWPAAVGLLTGVFAKEAVVGTLSSLYGQAAAREPLDFGARLLEALRSVPAKLGVGPGRGAPAADPELFAHMREHFSPAAAYAYLLFVLLYVPCAASLGAAIREMGYAFGWILATTLTTVAWSAATLFYQVASGPDPFIVTMAAVLLATVTGSFALAAKRRRAA